MNNKQVINGSFFQDEKHPTRGPEFQAIKPDVIREVLDSHGFDLVHLRINKARKEDRAEFQTSVARYRSRDEFSVDGLGFDLIFKVPHLYGALQGVLGLFRGTCSNQLNVGTHFDKVKVNHSGDPYSELSDLIPRLVSQRQKLVETVKLMQAKELTPSDISGLAVSMAEIRLAEVTSLKKIKTTDLLTVRRLDDDKRDLFTVYNVLQENLLRYGVRYEIESQLNGETIIQQRTTRKVAEDTPRAIELNGMMWDKATRLLSVG